MELEGKKVVVVGGATGGCAAALLLARAGARVTLLERIAEPRAVGAGIGLAENGMAVLEGLGLGPEIAASARPVRGGRIVDAARRTLLDPGGAAPEIRMIRRSDLQRALLDAVAAESRIDARFGVEAVAAASDGRLEVSGPDGSESLVADLVVGADGVHSRVRDGGPFDARVDARGIAYVRALARGAEPLVEEAWSAAGLFGSFAVADGVYWYASAGAPEVARALDARDLDAFRAVWRRAYPAATALLDATASFDDLVVNRVVRVVCGRWSDGRRVLIGDAAHAMAPNLGQGANSALVDATVLVDELRRADDLAGALAAYEARRKPAVERVAALAHRLGRIAEWRSAPARALRDRLLLPLAARLDDPARQRALVLQEEPATLRALAARAP
ncbi:MAG: FAD-dependent monooxygenase [Holophagales bacterium]|nr:FAD-dependent monooxygenase [Holophagales bacterium]